ncbi:MAG: transposase [Erysipelotrichaceae bacterium]|nr:transposase [Erysipelotrichaceae bacterium]
MPLTDVIATDEVYLNFDHNNRYALVIMDFRNSQILDILPNRNKNTIVNYFNSISKNERDKVKYIVSDMYNAYLNLPCSFFKNAISIVDSCHVIQWINNKINIYINSVKKAHQKENYENNRNYQTKKDSREVYILKNFK